MKNRHFNIMNVIDARRRENKTIQIFFIKKSLKKYTKKIVNYLFYDNRKARKFLRQFFRKFRKNKIKNMNKFSLFSFFYVQNERDEIKNKNKTFLILFNEEKTRSIKKQQLMKKLIEIINNHFYIEFEFE